MLVAVLLLLLPLATFVVAERATRTLTASDPVDPRRHAQAIARLGRVFGSAALTLMALYVVVLRTGPMRTVVVSAAMLAAGGAAWFLSRRQCAARVTVRGAVVWTAFLVWWIHWGLQDGTGKGAQPGGVWLMPVLSAFLLLCIFCTRRKQTSAAPRLGRLVGLVLLAAILSLPVGIAWNSGPLDDNRLVELARAGVGRGAGSVDWPRFAEIAQYLDSRGIAWDRTQGHADAEQLARAQDAWRHGRLDDMLRAGLLEADTIHALLAGPYAEERARFLGPKAHVLPSMLDDGALRLVVIDPALTTEERARLVALLDTTWPDKDALRPLESARHVCDLLARLGAADRIVARRDSVHRLLVGTWCAEANTRSRGGGFARRWGIGRQRPDEQATLDALVLMEHVGVPADVDLDQVAGYLRKEARGSLLQPFAPIPRFSLIPKLALRRLEAQHGVLRDGRAWLNAVRDPLAVGLLLILLVLLLRRAPDVRVPDPNAPTTEQERAAALEQAMPELRRRRKVGWSPYDRPGPEDA